MIQARYSGLLVPTRLTLGRLLNEPGFRKLVDKLRDGGWLDWHILTAVANVTANYRLGQIPHASESD
jgi:hypothetical protein